MGFYRGPNVVTNGLVLALDAANAKSYPGSGTVWRDLSGNNNSGSLTNGPTFSSANGGSIVFDGVDDTITNFPIQISGTGAKTINCFVKPSSTIRMGLCGTRSNLLANGWVFTINRTTAGNLTYFHTGGSTLEVAAGIRINNWYNAAVTYNLSTTTATLYLNGIRIGNPDNTFSNISTSEFNGFIGAERQGVTTDIMNGSIATIQIYNRALSAAEILQNYNATKARFNLS